MLDQSDNVQSIFELLQASLEGLMPPVKMSLPEFALEHIYIENAATAGRQRYSFDKAPYQRGILECLGDPLYQYINVVAPSRAGKTYLSLISSAYWAFTNPRDLMFVHPNYNRALKFANKDLRRFLDDNPWLRKMIQEGRSTDRLLSKQFKNGTIHTHTWPSPENLSGSDEAVINLPDYDRADSDIGGEGSLKEQADARTKMVGFDKTIFTESSPSKNPDKFERFEPKTNHAAPPYPGILSLYDEGDRRWWYWRCVSCHESFPAHPKFLDYSQDEDMDIQLRAATARMICPHCKQDYAHDGVAGSAAPGKYELNKSGLWVPDGMTVSKEGDLEGEMIRPAIPGQMNTASFWLMGPAAAFQTWQELVRKKLNAEKIAADTNDEDVLKTVMNTDFGMPWIPPHILEARDWEALFERAYDIKQGVVPEGARYLIVTIDCQKYRWEIQTHAMGRDGRMWIIDRQHVRSSDRDHATRRNADGTPEKAYVQPGEYAEDWQKLTDRLMSMVYPLHDGSGVMVPALFGCDTGGDKANTAHSYEWWRSLKDPALPKSRVVLLKGDPHLKDALSVMKTNNGQKRSNRNAGNRGDVPVLHIASNTAKDILSSILERQVDGPNFIHLPGWAKPSWFKEMVAEHKVGNNWEKISEKLANESWDLTVYALVLNRSDKLKAHMIDWSSDDLPFFAAYARPAAENPFVTMITVNAQGETVPAKPQAKPEPYLMTYEEIGREMQSEFNGYT